ncbi:replication restart DNA helicase PriA [Marivirga sericea]|uniref:Replication restart protein PriA n=1 Tax=Marivirga sericea TaxID=1028 RepID=A0A1X7KAG5_9BACT|nr:primosomal protein N' [Marivirga sericea]SMG37448.1 replication restart DNA helicase PriA [Marivirga sericea]
MSQLSLNSIEEESLRKTYFVQVLLPVPIPKTFTYRVPQKYEEFIQVGIRAIVPFGKKKIIAGVISAIHEEAPKDYEAKYILEILDEYPVVSRQQFKLFEWIAQYYMATEGEVLNVGLPSGLKLSSESKIQLNPAFQLDQSPYIFSQIEEVVINLLKKEGLLSYEQFAEITNAKQSSVLIKELLKKQVIMLIEQVQERYKPKTEKRLRLQKDWLDEAQLHELMQQLDKKPKQLDVLLKYLQEVPVFNDSSKNEIGVAKSIFKEEQFSTSSINTLIKHKIFEEYEVITSRLDYLNRQQNLDHEITLSTAQENCRDEINSIFAEKDVALLHGVTGSGKTEIYLSLIREVIDSGSQALFLLPEIAITTQMIQRVRKIFGDQVGIYHSKFSDAERVEVWQGVAEGTINFVIGVRSSVLLPFNNLSLIVVDEEHESSYKQYEPAPRYNARDTAVVLANIHNAKLILGSATPSYESYYNAKTDKYGLSILTERYGEGSMPSIEVIDMRRQKAKKLIKDDFSHSFLAALESEMNKGNQAIIFQNRRGYAPYLQCETCGWISECENCSVSLTYHMHQHELKCHYCGYRQKSPSACLSCESTALVMKGFGTEKIEDDLKLHFPEVKIQRMDRDTTRKKYSYQQIIESFESGETQILIGTQMVTKGLDFENVSIVGIVDADRMMYYPDFRAHERAFQLMLQVSGRAGRSHKKGKVWIQSFQENHPLFDYLLKYDYEGFYELQLKERHSFFYPPYCRLIKIVLKGAQANAVRIGAKLLYESLIGQLGNQRVLAPHEPMIAKIRNIYHMELWIKLEKGYPLEKTKHQIKASVSTLQENSQFRKLRVNYDVDPQ